MIYLERFTFPDDEREFDYILGVKRKCYTSFYPFKVLSARGLKRLDFESVTILYGGNGSGKSTALHVIAKKAGLTPGAPFNRTSFFDDYVDLCGMKAFLTHGHRYAVRSGRLDTLLYAAECSGAQIVMFGHTHRAGFDNIGGMFVLNPGTAGQGLNRTWAKLELGPTGEIHCEICEIK